MISKKRKNFNLSRKLTASILLSIFLTCPIFADNTENETYFDYIAQLNNQKLYNPIILDTSRATTVAPKTNTSIPFNLREFNESDYFSSTIEESPQANQNSPPDETIKAENETKVEKIEDISTKENSFAPHSAALDFFEPTSETIETKKAIAEEKPAYVEEKKSEFLENTVFANNSYIEDQYSEYEGKIVSKVNFTGLNSFDSSYILSLINTQKL